MRFTKLRIVSIYILMLVFVLPAMAGGAGFSVGTGKVKTDANDEFGYLEEKLPAGMTGLSDPGVDRVMFWDDSAGAVTWLAMGSGLSVNGTTLTATGGGSGVGQNLITNSGLGVTSQSTLEIDPDDATAVTCSDVTSGVCLTSETQGIAIGDIIKFASGDFSGKVYVVTSVVNDTSITLKDTSITDIGAPGALNHMTPGFVAADTKAPDGWVKSTSLDVWRIQGDDTKDGAFYGLKLTSGANDDVMYWPKDRTDYIDFIKIFESKTVAFGAWVKTTATDVLIAINDGTHFYSDYHSGSGNWEWLECSGTISSATKFKVLINFVTSSKTAYFAQPMLVFGSSIGEGNYAAPSNETIFFDAGFISNTTKWQATAYSDTNGTLSWEADFIGKIPKTAKGVYALIQCRDSGGSGYFAFDGLVDDLLIIRIDVNGITGDTIRSVNGLIPAYTSLNALISTYNIDASGSGTMDIWVRPFGVLLQ